MKYPTVYLVVCAIAEDNNMQLRKNPDWSDLDLQRMEDSLKKLTPDEIELLAAGEQEEAKNLLEDKLDWEYVNSFFNEVFDGRYHYNFYV